MYINPMTIYREYVQNAADAIDEARRVGTLGSSTPGRVEINIDYGNRAIRIRDNGTGVDGNEFVTRLTSFGASAKRGERSRGFRGVGRLSGIGYCQELVFRSRGNEEDLVSELRWDCRRIKTILRSADFVGDLANLLKQTVETRTIQGRGWPEHFFEVELRGIVRHGNDCLLNPAAIENYLSQVAPVPFCPEFRFGKELESVLSAHVALGNVEITIAGMGEPVYRPYRNRFEIANGVFDEFSKLEFTRVPAVDGGTAALGWVLHHGYKGAIPPRTKIKGLRLRRGNMQVGEDDLMEDLFPEPRFNSWSVGEVHVVDDRIVPNGRRDHFEQNVHYNNLVNHISPVARAISNLCRTNSLRRNWLREFERQKSLAMDTIAIIRQGTLSSPMRKEMELKIKDAISEMERISGREQLAMESAGALCPAVRVVRRQLARIEGTNHRAKHLEKMPAHKRRVYEHVFGLIYECSPNPAAAKGLVDRIMTRLS
jgi:molecular chaperone HtpG